MSSQDIFEDKLNKVVENLGQFEPANEAWLKIESQLSFEQKLDNEAIKLQEIDFKPGVWNNIESGLKQNHKIKSKRLLLYSFSAAASVILLLGVSKFFISNDKIQITHSEEFVVDKDKVVEIEVDGSDPLKYLEENCKTVPDVCETPQFLEQKRILEELNDEHKNLTEVIQNYGESPELIKSLIKVENLKSEIVKEMMKAINS